MCVSGGYACLWGPCDFESVDSSELMRHINYHSYHTKLKCIGSNILARSRLPVSNGHSVCSCFIHLLECLCDNF
jgi:hypothetical protein